jgi:anti-sigma regulatory factor (Ser/Thr protein kinase)
MTRPRTYRHDALFYDGADEFHTSVLDFVEAGVAADSPVLVVASRDKIERLRPVVDSSLVALADMADVGRNPARIIPAWRAFVDGYPSRAVRGVGEPITPDRPADELVECQHMESLLNHAFVDADDFWLRCPYDVGVLEPEVVEEARRSHPVIVHGDADDVSASYVEADDGPSLADAQLPEPTAVAAAFTLRPGRLAELRTFVARQATAAGLTSRRVDDLVLAANEIACNSLLYAGGGADVRIWRDHTVVCEVRDAGVITDPLIGRVLPGAEEHDARGVWIANQVCDMVQVRSSVAGTTVRLHVRPDS